MSTKALRRALAALAAANITHRSQRLGIALTLDHGADDFQAGHTADGADDVAQLQVHMGQCLLRVLQVGRRILEMSLADAHIGAQRRDVASRRYDFALMQAPHDPGWITAAHGRSEPVCLTDASRLMAKNISTHYLSVN